MEIFLVWLLFAVLVAAWARAWNRSGFGDFTLAALLSPIVGAIILLVAGKRKPENAKQKAQAAD